MTVAQLLHRLAEAAEAKGDAQPDWFCWRFRTADSRFEFTPRPELALEPLDAGRHIPRGLPQTKSKKLRNGKTDVEVSPAPRPRYKLYLADVAARVSDDDIARLNAVGDAARKHVIQTALDDLEERLTELSKPGKTWSF